LTTLILLLKILVSSRVAEDIRLFLCSRYGIVTTNEEVCKTILHGLGGSGEEDESIDIMELATILLIPTLNKAATQHAGATLPEGVVPTPTGMLDYVLKMILHDVSVEFWVCSATVPCTVLRTPVLYSLAKLESIKTLGGCLTLLDY
jgi:hypothetical protein